MGVDYTRLISRNLLGPICKPFSPGSVRRPSQLTSIDVNDQSFRRRLANGRPTAFEA
jgi:hypothetical protein